MASMGQAFTQALQKVEPSWMFGNRDLFVVNVEDITLVLEGEYELAPPKLLDAKGMKLAGN